MTITFETKVWENDWQYILEGDYLKQMIARCNMPFNKKVLFINNVNDRAIVEEAAQIKVDEGVIDQYCFVADFATEALAYFNIEKESFKGGYYYSIAELVSIYRCDTDYLLHFSSDSYMATNATHWIADAMAIMESKPHIVVANPTWNNRFNEAKRESEGEIDGFYLGYGFSDQCYLVKTSVFKQPIYNETHPDSRRYPKYGGELFEKRVDSFMRNHAVQRITSKTESYISKNFSKNWLLKNVASLRAYYIKQRLKK